MTLVLTVMGVSEQSGSGAFQTPLGAVTTAMLVQAAVVGTLFALGSVAAFSYIAAARSACDEERDRVAAELAAFERFGERVRALSPRSAASAEAFADGSVVARGGARPPDDALEPVRRAYRETAMAVDHFEEDYDETLAEHARAELGPDAGGALAEGRDLTPGLQAVLADRAAAAAAQRRKLLDRLAEEDRALADAEHELTARVAESGGLAATDGDFGALEARWRRLETLERHVRDRTVERSRRLREGGAEIPTYLYERFPVPDPVLADAAAAVGVIRDRRDRVTDALTRAN
ncbi:DUF7260 family protein [Halosegnis marinus]|uniref:DUF7260 domain-containing protein n=1 Tax=Halosegnis marinus TaxID=3034023 RepID=A0ABD5ZSE9_9EURY|nr:hypothetical protein [Halosegnis sp. DT85]